MRYPSLLVAVCFSLVGTAQELTGNEVLEKSIKFHDPYNKWNSFKGNFKVVMETPSNTKRVSTVSLDLPKQSFALQVDKDRDSYTYTMAKDSCSIALNGVANPKEEDLTRLKLSCERAALYKNYYTYLYGLPMKLKDPGALIHPIVKKRAFKGKEYLVIRVDYEKEVGQDRWYFYFDPQSYAMEVYQFYHEEQQNDGEYILLKDLETINTIKMPKIRAWYYNKDDSYLGTDVLSAD